jgi:hypothetical protein
MRHSRTAIAASTASTGDDQRIEHRAEQHALAPDVGIRGERRFAQGGGDAFVAERKQRRRQHRQVEQDQRGTGPPPKREADRAGAA